MRESMRDVLAMIAEAFVYMFVGSLALLAGALVLLVTKILR